MLIASQCVLHCRFYPFPRSEIQWGCRWLTKLCEREWGVYWMVSMGCWTKWGCSDLISSSLKNIRSKSIVWKTSDSCCGPDTGNLEPGTLTSNGMEGYVFSQLNTPSSLRYFQSVWHSVGRLNTSTHSRKWVFSLKHGGPSSNSFVRSKEVRYFEFGMMQCCCLWLWIMLLSSVLTKHLLRFGWSWRKWAIYFQQIGV